MILIACPDCDRQYDVTHVDPGDRVRCQCDRILSVGTPGSLRVQALHCSHCGGAVQAEDPSCAWCGAKLSEADRRASTLCPKCFKRIEEDSKHCKGCGVAIAPQALTPVPADQDCPRCAGELQIRALGTADVIECSGCGGLWLTSHVFEAVCRDTERRLDTFLLAPPEGDPAQAPEPPGRVYIACMGCGQLMLRRNFRIAGRSSGVIVDYCRGHGVWLDHQELERVAEFIRTHGTAGGSRGPGLEAYLSPRPAPRAAPKAAPAASRGTSLGEGNVLTAAIAAVLEIGFDLFDL